jgi:type IV secretory pathway component VirB8
MLRSAEPERAEKVAWPTLGVATAALIVAIISLIVTLVN